MSIENKPPTKITLPSGAVIELNEQQEEALQRIQAWLISTEHMQFTLMGYAGTGKTTIVKNVLDTCDIAGTEIGITAPTHKALRQLELSTDREGMTIQALLGLAPNVSIENFDINKPEFGQLKSPKIDGLKLVVVDESSMLNKDLCMTLLALSEDFNVKVLFMCDEAQLPPVNEKIAVVIDPEIIPSRYCLTQVMRQSSDNPLMGIYDKIRNNLSSQSDTFSKTTQTNERGGIEFLPSLSAFGNKVVTEFASQAFINDPLHCRVLCWTNERVAFWNNAIRQALYAHNTAQIDSTADNVDIEMWKVVMPGNLLMGYTNSGNVENSAEYRVLSGKRKTVTIEYGVTRNEVDVDVYMLQVLELASQLVFNFPVLVPQEKNIRAFRVAFDYYLDQAKFNKKWKEYFRFKDQFIILEDIKEPSGKLVLRKDVDFSYALTVHKSQGSTYNRVFLDMPDMDKNRNVLERNKLKYVALSRPRQTAVILAA